MAKQSDVAARNIKVLVGVFDAPQIIAGVNTETGERGAVLRFRLIEEGETDHIIEAHMTWEQAKNTGATLVPGECDHGETQTTN